MHAHPPHATAFAIANVDIPSCLIPEAEVFLGKIGVAEYKTPGTQANSDEVGEVGKDHQAVLMQNHGVIVWGKDVEDAYWKMENIDSYCRTVWIAAGLGGTKAVDDQRLPAYAEFEYVRVCLPVAAPSPASPAEAAGK